MKCNNVEGISGLDRFGPDLAWMDHTLPPGTGQAPDGPLRSRFGSALDRVGPGLDHSGPLRTSAKKCGGALLPALLLPALLLYDSLSALSALSASGKPPERLACFAGFAGFAECGYSTFPTSPVMRLIGARFMAMMRAITRDL